MWARKEDLGPFEPHVYKRPHMPSMWARTQGLSPLDPSSYSRPDLAKVVKMRIELTVNFDERVFKGMVILSIRKRHPKVTKILLDICNLKILRVYESILNKSLKYSISEPIGDFGSKLAIQLPRKPSRDDPYVVYVSYITDSSANGLQWLNPMQTAGKEFPFVVSQFQAIRARSVIPCQDSPGVKCPYFATIAVPQGMVVVMSAPRVSDVNIGNITTFQFDQTIPVPSCLIAFAIGALESREIGPRSHVWAEKELVDSAASEFEDIETQLRTAEDICGAYEWDVFDLLVLPNSFPFAGLEYPCLTFVAASLIANDTSRKSLLATEIAHSWAGNLLTSRNFEHMWLTEGLSTFLGRKIIGRLINAQEQDFEAICGLNELKTSVGHLGSMNVVTSLIVDLSNLHPDEAFSAIPFEKGHIFLRHLEDLVGGPDEFEPFLRSYFYTYKFKIIETEDFKEHFVEYFSNISAISRIDWNTWLHKLGMPPIIPKFDRTFSERCTYLKKRLINWKETSNQPPFTSEDFNILSSSQLKQFLQEVLDSKPQSITKLQALQNLFDFDGIQNSEIKLRWLRICIKARWEEKIPIALKWLSIIGRPKYMRALYHDLFDWEKSRLAAINNFFEHRKEMVDIVVQTIAHDLKISK